MYRKWLGIAAVALVGLMLIPEPASAQGRGWYRGWYGGPGWTYSGYYGPYWGRSYYGGWYSRPYYYGGYYSRPFYSNYYGPSYYTYDYYVPRYYTYDYYMPRYNYSYGTIDSGYYSNSSDSMTAADYEYGAAPGQSTALVDIKVPPDATIWFDETQMAQRGSFRQFITPPLDSSRNFSYEVHAQWKEGDRTINQTREVTVHAGDQLLVDFTTRPAEGQPKKGPPPVREAANMHEGTFLSFGGTELVMTDMRGKRHSHTLAADAVVTIDGRPASAEDLKSDMHIKVTTQKGDPNTVTRIEARSNGSPGASGEPRETRLESHEGTFISLSNNELVIDQKGKRHSHKLAADAQVVIDGQPARPEDLKADMRIKVTTRKGDPNTVTRIEARTKK